MSSGSEEHDEEDEVSGSEEVCQGRTLYSPVSQMRREPVWGEAVSMRWF